MDDIDKIKKLSKELRLEALSIAYRSGNNGSHLGGGLSTVEIFATLYGSVLRYNLNNKNDENRDRLIVSKGHCVLAYYSALHKAGFISDKELYSFETNGSCFHGHAMRNLQFGIEFSGGSLSMGMSFAVGVAIACKKRRLGNRIYTIVGDGECDEGLIWESAMAAANYKLDNLCVIVDCNKLQYDGFTNEIMDSSPLIEKFRSFGFCCYDVDGHNCEELYNVMMKKSDKPMCIIANTIKGKGVSFIENKKEWHHHTLNKSQYEAAIKEVTNE